jgi:hypothetical protein
VGHADETRERRIEPDPGGTVFRVIDYPPDSERLKKHRPEAHFASMGAQAAPRREAPPSGMHRTRTLDYAIVLSGEIYALLDEGEVRSRGRRRAGAARDQSCVEQPERPALPDSLSCWWMPS